ncbi:hypothetical protein HK100_002286 [Physocladia obscura]|uniref:Vacuolar protein sorting-associated protein 16 homolog n=1 Tax=Physocladia obscura TaxID=109957 RepID=A0AAD5T9Y5_9FUNG|nr:hypothetical protein HK100_002286 [Physocladia obscura]
MDWTTSEKLVCVFEAGLVKVVDFWGESFSFTLGTEARDFGVLECRFFGTGFVALTGNVKLILVDKLNEPKPLLLPDSGFSVRPTAWIVIPPHQALSNLPTILLAIKSTLLQIDVNSIQDLRLNSGPYTNIAFSPNAKFISLFSTATISAKVLVISADFTKQLAEFNPGASTSPLNMAWCGNDAVALHWEDSIVIVGPFSDSIRWTVEGVCVLISEIDGVRVVGSEKSWFIEKVPNATEDVFKIGSTAPGAILYDAFDNFQKKSPRADENIRNIKSELSLAVDTCLEAAAHEFNSSRQKSLLRAASFGKCFIPEYNADKFTNICETIRVLNAVRRFEIGIPLTFSQYCQLTPEVLTGRLAQRLHYSLALNICNQIKSNPSRILIHWACTKIKNAIISGDSDMQALLDIIVKKLSEKVPNISYIQIAKTAYQHGATQLAAQLLDYEPIAANQVPILMSMDLDDRALVKAIESGDMDLAYAVILHVKRKHNMAEFFRILKGKSIAIELVEGYARSMQDMQLLKDFYYQDDRRVDMARVLIGEAFEVSQFNSRVSKLKDAARLFLEAGGKGVGSNGGSGSSGGGFEAKVIEDHIKLIGSQITLEKDTGEVFCNLSISETIYKLLILGYTNNAAKLKSDLKVPDRRYLWLKLRAFVETANWEGVDKLLKSNGKIIAIDSVVDLLLEKGEIAQAKIYQEQLRREGGQESNPFLTLIKSAIPNGASE